VTDTGSPREVITYVDRNDNEPFTKWLNNLRDAVGRRHILRRMQKLKQGIYGDHKLLGQGLCELRIFFGPGYRVYTGEHGNKIVILLGGDKDSQQSDIQRARDYWQEYKNHEKLL
jgi:putative addiction module killer protein